MSGVSDNPWGGEGWDRTVFAEDVREHARRTAWVAPALVAAFVAYVLLSVGCQVYVGRHQTETVLGRIDELTAEVRALKAATVKSEREIRENTARIGVNAARIGDTTTTRGKAGPP